MYVKHLSLYPSIACSQRDKDQWKKKKQTKEQAAAAKRAKLDPDSVKNAKDVMDEAARKRKLAEMENSDSDIEGIEKELPKQGLKIAKDKKQKLDSKTSKATAEEDKSAQEKDQKRKADLERRKEKQQKKAEKQAQKAEKRQLKKEKLTANEPTNDETEKVLEFDNVDVAEESIETPAEDDAADIEHAPERLEKVDLEGLVDEEPTERPQQSSASPSPAHSPLFDNSTPLAQSAATSTSSTIPAAKAPRHIKIPTDPELLKTRLAARIEALRAARKADGPDGMPARNRQELMEARRKKEEQRRAHKKELRKQARADEEARREAALASARNSPASILSPAIHTAAETNFSFGRVEFNDGHVATADLADLREAPKRKGPQDAATALAAAEKKRLRLAGLDDEKRAEIEEKDLWLNAKKKAHGERIRDDTSLLKKTLKRKEKGKKKSEREWGERKEGVAKAQAAKQKKREENLRKRRDEKGSKGKGSKGVKSKGKSRPGFEGRFGGKKK